MKYVVIGGVAGGASAVARLRRLDENAEIVLFERGEYISYANCGLPYYIGGVIGERDKLFVQTPVSFSKRFAVEVRVGTNVERVDRAGKCVQVVDLSTGRRYEEKYDKLILSPGAEPVRPPLEGIGLEGIFTLRNVQDTDRIKRYVSDGNVKRAVIVGAGFIGLEMAENLHRLDVDVIVVEMAEQVMTPVDFEVAAVVHQHLKSKGIGLLLQEAVSAFERNGVSLDVKLKSGRVLTADMVLLSIGVRPDVRLAKEAGLAIGETGGIKVNEFLQTSDADVYAVGDVIEFVNPVSGKPSLSFLAGPANKQGRICADNVLEGNKILYKGSINTAIAKVFDLTVGTSGLSARLLDKLGIAYRTTIVHAGSHAGYYPGAIPLTIKINFSPESGKLLGAQVVGYEGVDKRIDMMAAVLKNGGSVYDLAELEHAYAPPYSSAKDPVNLAGFVADNMLSGKVDVIDWKELQGMDKSDVTLIDVRSNEESGLGIIPGSVNIPLDELRDRLGEINEKKPVVVYCAVGLRGYVATRLLMQHGFKVRNLTGGMKTYDVATAEQGGEAHGNHKPDRGCCERNIEATVMVDACGLQCPGPVMKLKEGMAGLVSGGRMAIRATDSGFARDVESWAKMTGNRVVGVEQEKGIITAILEKGDGIIEKTNGNNGKTIIVFSDDLDKALASFVIANGAAATGRNVTMFFTFWGLSVIKRAHPGKVRKDFMGRMFGMMLPSGSKGLSLSKMNMWGMGSYMMRWIMKGKKIDSLESLIVEAQRNGVEFIACQMSMDVMGVKKEELLDGVNVGGVAAYLERAEGANVNLFI